MFRDCKDTKYGFGFNQTVTKTTHRRDCLWLIVAMGIYFLVIWLACLQTKRLDKSFIHPVQQSEHSIDAYIPKKRVKKRQIKEQ